MSAIKPAGVGDADIADVLGERRLRRLWNAGRSWELGRRGARVGGPPFVAFVAGWLIAASRAPGGWVAAFEPSTWERNDSGQYLRIARHGYRLSTHCTALTFPRTALPGKRLCGNVTWFAGYPAVIRALSLTGMSMAVAGLIITWLCWYLALLVIWLLSRPEIDGPVATAKRWMCLSLAAVFPGQIYFAALFPISLVALGMLAGVYFATRRRQKWHALAAGVAAGGAYLASVALLPGFALAYVVRSFRKYRTSIGFATAGVCLGVLGVRAMGCWALGRLLQDRADRVPRRNAQPASRAVRSIPPIRATRRGGHRPDSRRADRGRLAGAGGCGRRLRAESPQAAAGAPRAVRCRLVGGGSDGLAGPVRRGRCVVALPRGVAGDRGGAASSAGTASGDDAVDCARGGGGVADGAAFLRARARVSVADSGSASTMTGVAATYTDYTDQPDAATRSRLSPRALRARLVPPFTDSALWGWVGPLLVTVLAAYLRFNRLSIPGTKAFDEVYYAHDAKSLLMFGVETGKNGPPETFGPAEYVVHPPLGKWMIGFGEWVSGYNSFGWRLSAAIVGTLSVLLVARIARRMTRSTLFGCAAGLLMCLDGLEYVQSRMAMLDIFLMFWVVVAFGFLILDRDQVRARLASRSVAIDGPDDARGFGPRVGFRWWLLACGVSLGCAAACKWDGAYYIPAFALLAMFWTMGAKRAAGVHKPFVSTLARDVPGGVLTMAVVPVATYTATWTGWFLSNGQHAWDRNWANGRATAWGLGWVPAWLRNPVRGLWHYHWEALNFHTHLTTYHKYRANAWGWLFENRPVLYYADYPHYGKLGCKTRASSGCARMIYNMGTPAIWWASIPVMLFMAYLVFRRDWRASAVLLPFLFGYVPWLFNYKRTMFYFYALPLLPFICIALALTMGYMVGDRRASPNRRMIGAMVAGSYMLIVVVLFFYFLPVLSERTIPFTGWQQRMWFQSWSEDSGS